MTDTNQELIDIVIENKDQDDNAICGLLIQSGVPFNKAKGVLNEILISQGLRMTKVQRDDKAEELMNAFPITEDTTSDEVVAQVETIAEELGCALIVARNYVKAAFTEAELPYPKASAGTGGPRAPRSPGFSGDAATVSSYAIQNPIATENDKQDFQDFMEANGGYLTASGKNKATRWYPTVADLRIFANQWKDAGNCA